MENQDTPRKRPLLKIFLSIACFVLILIALTPVIISSDFGQKRMIPYLEGKLDGKIHVEKFSISLLDSQEIRNFTFKSQDNSVTFSVKEITIDNSLISIIFKGGNFGKTIIDSPKLNIYPVAADQKSSSSSGAPMLPIAGDFILKDGSVTIQQSQITPIRFENINMKLELPSSRKRLVFDVTCQAYQGKDSGDLNIKGNITSGKELAYDINATITKFPMDGVDEVLGMIKPSFKGKIKNGLGSVLNLSLRSISKNNRVKYFLSASSPVFNLSNLHFLENGSLKLMKPASITYQITPEMINSFSPEKKMALKTPVTLQGTIHELSIPVNRNKLPDFENMVGLLSLQMNDISFSRFHDLVGVDFKQPAFDIKINELDSIEITGKTLVNISQGDSIYSIIGGNVNMTFDIVADAIDGSLPKIDVSLLGTDINAKILAKLTLSHNFVFTEPLTVDLKFDTGVVNSILSKHKYSPRLLNSTPLHMEINPDRNGFRGNGSVAQMTLVSQNGQHQFYLKEIDLNGNLNQKTKALDIDFSAKAFDQSKPSGMVKGSFALQDQKMTNGTIQVDDFSTLILDSMLSMNQELSQIIGNIVDMQLNMGNDFDLSAKSPLLEVTGRFNLDKGISLKGSRSPLKVAWTMTNEGYAAIGRLRNSRSATPLTLTRPAQIEFYLTSLNVPMNAQGMCEWMQALFDGQLSIDQVSFKEPNQSQVTTLNNFILEGSKKKAGSPFAFDLNSSISSGKVNARGTISNYTDAKGDLNFDKLATDITGRAVNLPTLFTDALFQFLGLGNTPPSAFLGPKLNVSFQNNLADGSGRLLLEIDATNCTATIDSAIANGVMYLNSPIQAQLKITDDLNRVLLRNMALVIQSASNPLSLYIDTRGFALPIKNYRLQNVRIGFGRLDFGQMVVRNAGNPSEVSSLFKLDVGRDSLIDLWFAPCDFTLHNGVLDIERTEILFEKAYEVAILGNVDLVRQYVKMTVGLSEQSLRATLGIKDVPQNYVLPIAFTGPYGNVRLHKEEATAKIALLIAGKAGQKQGGIFGNVLGILGQLAQDQSSIPPAKHPFPWEK